VTNHHPKRTASIRDKEEMSIGRLLHERLWQSSNRLAVTQITNGWEVPDVLFVRVGFSRDSSSLPSEEQSFEYRTEGQGRKIAQSHHYYQAGR
jgi:hypothetical protein